jgi:hypothetical protein
LERTITYFESRGSMSTAKVFDLVAERAATLGIGTVVVPSTGGATGLRAVECLQGLDVVVVSHSTGYGGPGSQQMPAETRAQIEEKGAKVLTTTHAFGGVGRGIRRKLATYQVDEIIAYTLRTFGQGTKVAIELALMAADAGLVRTDEDVISIGGTVEGADAALVLQPANSSNFFDLKVREVIAKPRNF